jgi:hypothetical protein
VNAFSKHRSRIFLLCVLAAKWVREKGRSSSHLSTSAVFYADAYTDKGQTFMFFARKLV